MTTNPVNTTTTITPPITQKQPLCSVQESKYRRIAAATTLLEGLVLIAPLVGALVFFALPTATTITVLTVLIGIALGASVILLSMAMYKLLRCRQVPSDPKGIEDSVTLKEEIIEIKAQLTQKAIQLIEEEERSASLLGQLLAITGDLEATQHQKSALEAEVKLLQEQYTSTLKLAEKDHSELTEVQQELDEKTARLEDFVKTTVLLEKQIAEKEQEIGQLNARVAELEAAAVVKAPESAEASETVEATEEVEASEEGDSVHAGNLDSESGPDLD
ncbi:IncA family protein [Chlamydia caviae]|uniref:IncA family protein n=1 Tax=Chlamydia caviae (strain ATCC VR-813 / DSM 19441 / 03DC25 / GPIC) TaxID=227941 RepID=Q821Y8_CHLCV|nr:IncA family protein [Chlamydia caviae]AAP05538.1 hypothetical protein CCA_00797 [Chlamydia caviae GPIC]